jgi:integrase
MALAWWRSAKGTGVFEDDREVDKSKPPLIKYVGADGKWRGPLVAKGCTNLKDAKEYAADLEYKARRQRDGLEPLEAPEDIAFGELLDPWCKSVLSKRESESKHDFVAMVRKHFGHLSDHRLGAKTVPAFACEVEEILRVLKEQDYAASTRRKLKSALSGIFREASNPKRKRWHFENPIGWLDPIKKQRGTSESLQPHEASAVLAGFDEPRLGAPWRWAAEANYWLGLRPGEIYGSWKDDVDLVNMVFTVKRSWAKPWPKDKDERPVPIPAGALPSLVAAMNASPNHLVFPDENGEVFPPTLRFALLKTTREAAVRAGVVAGYSHRCESCTALVAAGQLRGDTVTEWRHADSEARTCPHCGEALVVTAVERKIGTYIWRHTYVTLLLGGGIDALAVSRLVGHEDVATTKPYDHRRLAQLRDQAQSVLGAISVAGAADRGEAGPKLAAPGLGEQLVNDSGAQKSEGPDATRFPEEHQGLRTVGATRFERATTCTPTAVGCPSTRCYRAHRAPTGWHCWPAVLSVERQRKHPAHRKAAAWVHGRCTWAWSSALRAARLRPWERSPGRPHGGPVAPQASPDEGAGAMCLA